MRISFMETLTPLIKFYDEFCVKRIFQVEELSVAIGYNVWCPPHYIGGSGYKISSPTLLVPIHT